jgi:hypothetical protein
VAPVGRVGSWPLNAFRLDGIIVNVITMPQPDDLTSLVIRTGFGDDRAWQALQAEVESSHEPEYSFATWISDPAYRDVAVDELVEADAAADDESKVFYLFLADVFCLADAEHRMLAVDLSREPGRTFRVPPHLFAGISANLSIANMDFAEFADAVDESGTYRGFAGE